MSASQPTRSQPTRSQHTLLRPTAPWIVLPRTHPDLDGVGCAVAYAELLRWRGQAALPFIPGTPDAEARFILEHPPLAELATEEQAKTANAFVLVDASDTPGLAPFVDPQQVVEVVDHRRHHKAHAVFPNARVHIEPVGAAATLIEERFVAHKRTPSPEAARLLYGAIHSNTQHLRGSVTTARDRASARRLLAGGTIPTNLLEGQFEARRNEILDNLETAIGREDKTFSLPDGPYHFTQLELSGATSLYQERAADLLKYLSRLHPRTILNLVDVTTGGSLLVVPDPKFRAWIRRRTGLEFQEEIAYSGQALLRKQVVAMLEGLVNTNKTRK